MSNTDRGFAGVFMGSDKELSRKHPFPGKADEGKSNRVKIQVITEKILRTDSIVIEINYVVSQGTAKRGGNSAFGGLGFFTYGKSNQQPKQDTNKQNKVLGLHELKETFKVTFTMRSLGKISLIQGLVWSMRNLKRFSSSKWTNSWLKTCS